MFRFFAWLQVNVIRFLRVIEFYQPTYNPNNYPLWPVYDAKRPSELRLKVIEKHIPWQEVCSMLDLGSQVGYFTQLLAQKHDLFAIGVDYDLRALRYAQSLSVLSGQENVGFVRMKLETGTVKSLPRTDLTLFLSVFHHLVHNQGFEAADKILNEIVKKTNYLVFETGQYGEGDLSWSGSLDFMGSKPSEWLKKYLLGKGCLLIDHSLHSNHLNDKKRSVFVLDCRKIS